MTNDYVVQVWMDGQKWHESLLTDCDDEMLASELETLRANHPGGETRIYTCQTDEQGGTITVFNLRRM